MNRISAYIYYVLTVTTILCLSSCQKISDEDVEDSDSDSVNELKLLNIKARSISDSEIDFPLYVYVFNSNGEFNSYIKANSANDSIQFSLGKNSYKIVTLSGCDNDFSLLENPSLSDIIKYKDESCNYAKRCMMMGVSDILVDKKDIDMELSMSYCVSSIEVFLNNIPLSAKKVKLSISPIYSSISYKGEYFANESSNEVALNCSLGIDGIWKAGPVYTFPGSSSTTTFKITIEDESSVKSYSYNFSGAPKASQPFIVKGNFVGDVTINGSVIAKGWEDPFNAEFEFSSSSGQQGSGEQGGGQQEPGNQDGGGEEKPSSNSPKAGEIWNGCIVADAQSTQNGVNLLLLSIKEWECTCSQTKGLVESYSVNGITGWTVPSWEQATFLRKTYNGESLTLLNEKIKAAGGEIIYDDEDMRFLCYNKDNIISSFRFAPNTKISKVTNESREYYLRAVKSYFYSNQ